MNVTPHAVTVLGEQGNTLAVYPPSGQVARVTTQETVVGHQGQVPLVACSLGPVVDLPEPDPGVLLIVSRLVADAAALRDDLLVPNRLVRDGDGVVVGCRSLAVVDSNSAH